MKKLLFLFLFSIYAPILGQENNKKDLYVETGVFSRIEGISLVKANSPEASPMPVSLTALEFSIGRDKIYFYSQLRFSTALPSYDDITGYTSVYYGRRLGFLAGLGGEIYDSNPDQDSKKFTMAMNFGLGGDFALDKQIQTVSYLPDQTLYYNNILNHYYTMELNLTMKYNFYKHFGLRWGFNLSVSGDNLLGESGYEYYSSDTQIVTRVEGVMIRYGMSFGFVF